MISRWLLKGRQIGDEDGSTNQQLTVRVDMSDPVLRNAGRKCHLRLNGWANSQEIAIRYLDGECRGSGRCGWSHHQERRMAMQSWGMWKELIISDTVASVNTSFTDETVNSTSWLLQSMKIGMEGSMISWWMVEKRPAQGSGRRVWERERDRERDFQAREGR